MFTAKAFHYPWPLFLTVCRAHTCTLAPNEMLRRASVKRSRYNPIPGELTCRDLLTPEDCNRRVDIASAGMPGKSFQSKLEPHFDLILSARRKRQTWVAIAQLLAEHGVSTTKQAVHAFLKRRLKRRYPLGMASVAEQGGYYSPEKSSPEMPRLTQLPPLPSETGGDPLTLPLKEKKPKWNQIR